jgi:electron transfer flavoprotein beta subunit
MEILVCIKQVPGTTSVQINPETGTLIREGVEAIVNPFDEFAIEEGLRIKEKMGGRVTVITMGPPQAESVLRKGLGMGADDAVLVSDRAFAGSDTWATGYTLSKAISTLGKFDLIICGKQAIDGDTAQVGPGVAEMLDIPFVAWVRKVEEITNDKIRVQRLMEDGYDVVEMPLPALITVVKEINEPRLESLKGKMKAKKAEIRKLTNAEIKADENKLGLKGSPTNVLRSFVPERKSGGKKITGETTMLVEEASRLIQSLNIVK